jgi:hypothetical protein
LFVTPEPHQIFETMLICGGWVREKDNSFSAENPVLSIDKIISNLGLVTQDNLPYFYVCANLLRSKYMNFRRRIHRIHQSEFLTDLDVTPYRHGLLLKRTEKLLRGLTEFLLNIAERPETAYKPLCGLRLLRLDRRLVSHRQLDACR